MKQQLIGREDECRQLRKYLDSDRPEFIAVYGRRRVGKTYMIKHIVGNDACFSFTGMENSTMQEQLANFYFALSSVYPSANRPHSWIEAFYELRKYLEQLPSGKKIIFIDELPWLDTVRSKFVSALESFWNGWADARDDIKLIVCGSSTSWMIDNVINNRGGLHNRTTHQLYVAPFTLSETNSYFSAYGFGYNLQEVAECYMVLGGVAYYYSLMDSALSVAQNIDRLFFSFSGELRNEFENLYRSLFKKSVQHIDIVTALAGKNKGLTRKQILEKSNLNNNSQFTIALEELEKCGFIRSYIPFGETKRDVLYQLTDAFTLFHFRYTKTNKFQDESYWTNSLNSPVFNSWSGNAFEILCLNHINQIKRALGIAGIQSRACCWTSRGTESEKGAQIDLIIDRADRTINICEIKYSKSEYEMTKSEYEKITNRIKSFQQQSKTGKSLMLTLITSYGLKQNKWSGHVQREVTLKDLMK